MTTSPGLELWKVPVPSYSDKCRWHSVQALRAGACGALLDQLVCDN